jgi:hypothetical protein
MMGDQDSIIDVWKTLFERFVGDGE